MQARSSANASRHDVERHRLLDGQNDKHHGSGDEHYWSERFDDQRNYDGNGINNCFDCRIDIVHHNRIDNRINGIHHI